MNREYLRKKIYKKYLSLTRTQAIEQLASDMNVSRNVIYNVLRYQVPKEDLLIKLKHWLELDMNELFNG